MNRRNKQRIILRILCILLGLGFVLSFLSCRSTKEATRYTHTDSTRVVKHDTLRTYKVVRDTLHTHDSIYVREMQKGDTIFLTTYKERTLYKSVLQHDTVYSTRTDTIYKEARTASVEKKEAERGRRSWLPVAVFAAFAAVLSFLYLKVRKA